MRASISSRAALTLLPPLAERLRGERRQLARRAPAAQRADEPAHAPRSHRRPLKRPPQPLRALVPPPVGERPREEPQPGALQPLRLGAHLLRPLVNEDPRDV